VSVALPFLESLPDRSAWAADEEPVFAFFICGVLGVVPAQFFPASFGPLSQASLTEANKATSELARHAERLLFLRNVNLASSSVSDPHIDHMCMALTARAAQGVATSATSTGPSADVVIAQALHPDRPPLTLYGGNKRNGYAAERLSFAAAGQVNAAVDNPYLLYQELVGLARPGGGMTPEGEEAARRLALSRNSIHDLVRDDLTALMANSRLSSADRERLQLHFQAIRDVEVGMGGMGDACSLDGVDVEGLEAMREFTYDSKGGMEVVNRLHMSLVALAFACNYRRVATLQWGDPVDKTRYDVPANEPLGWPYSFISHRAQSDSAVGMDPQAELAHAEIDRVQMASLAAGLDHFAARGLADNCFVMWMNSLSDGPSHSYRNIPHVIWGNAGGALKQAEYVDGGNVGNNRVLNTLISAAIKDTGTTVSDFGEGTPGQLDAILA
jgi:hypothetical protein